MYTVQELEQEIRMDRYSENKSGIPIHYFRCYNELKQ